MLTVFPNGAVTTCASLAVLSPGCDHSIGPGGQREDLPVDQRAVQPRDQGECPPGAQQEEGVGP